MGSTLYTNALFSHAQSILPHYNTNELKGLPSDAAPEGVLADGDIYFKSSEMLTQGDVDLLQQATGQVPSSSENLSQEQAALQNNSLAQAIGFDRAMGVIGIGGLTGNVTSQYLALIQSAITSPTGDGTYEGFQISETELTAAENVVAGETGRSINTSA